VRWWLVRGSSSRVIAAQRNLCPARAVEAKIAHSRFHSFGPLWKAPLDHGPHGGKPLGHEFCLHLHSMTALTVPCCVSSPVVPSSPNTCSNHMTRSPAWNAALGLAAVLVASVRAALAESSAAASAVADSTAAASAAVAHSAASLNTALAVAASAVTQRQRYRWQQPPRSRCRYCPRCRLS
jgi:hypothetical protein